MGPYTYTTISGYSQSRFLIHENLWKLVPYSSNIVFFPDLSTGDPYLDTATIIDPGYSSLVTSIGSETGLAAGT